MLCDGFDEMHNRTPDRFVADAHERLDKGLSVGGREKICSVDGGRRLCLFRRLAGSLRNALEEKGHGDIEYMTKLLQAARADPVGALFVFLDLLKRQAQLHSEPFLAHAEH